MPADRPISINQVTTRERWTLEQAVDGYARHGVAGIGTWSEGVREMGVARAARRIRDAGLAVTGHLVGGLLTESEPAARRARIDDNLRVIEEAAEIGARCIVTIAGGLPAGERDLEGARARALDGLAEILPAARAAGVTLGLEPLHPMICAARSVLPTLEMANDWYEALAAGGDGRGLGIVVDVYAVWWDPALAREIDRARGRICAFHVSDWLAETVDLRLDRGMMGDGVIDIPGIRVMVEAAGFDGMPEVEIFSARDWWRRDPDEVVRIVRERCRTAV
ncbi:MAG: sugar phosphate isomerase/epimerase [Thalassobaculum sp.]|uniref:sugar phosphate isomerase/epimerase family protein n=1 Tax=Thalassobaculum sp. TaxID=2022740 RepID=UPI0032EB7475